MYHQVEQNFSATAHLTQIILWYGKLYCICKMSYIQQSRLYPLDTYSTPTPDIQQWLQTLPNVSWGKNHPQLRNSGLDVAIHYGKKKISAHLLYISIFQSLSHVWLFVTPWTEAHQTPLLSTISRNVLKFMSIELVMLSNHLISIYN